MGYCLLSAATHGPRETDICQELPSCSYQDYVHYVMAILLVVQMTEVFSFSHNCLVYWQPYMKILGILSVRREIRSYIG
jgi:hypothetical protein